VRVAFQQDVAVPAFLPPGYEMTDAKPRTWILRVTGQLGSLPAFLVALPVADLAGRSEAGRRAGQVLPGWCRMTMLFALIVQLLHPSVDSSGGRRVAGGLSGCFILQANSIQA
jgi:hypothetical protein